MTKDLEDRQKQNNQSLEGEINLRDIPYRNNKKGSNDTSNKNEDRTDLEKLQHTLVSAKRILLKIRAVFPFDFFPNEIIVDENKVDIVSRKFFFSKEVFSIPIMNINGVTSSSNLVFGEIRIEAWGIHRLPEPVRYLRKQDALKARRIIGGLIMANREKVDIANIPLLKARKVLEEIGRSQEQYKNVNSA